MAFKDLARLSRQHRTIYCYFILSIWIFLLIAGMYKYIGVFRVQNYGHYGGSRDFIYASSQGHNGKYSHEGIKNIQECNNPGDLALEMEGGLLEGWTLSGVLLVLRHGDRGAMQNIRGIGSINCGYEDTLPLLYRYKSFIANSTISASFGHSVWLKSGSFHGFPLLPPLDKICLLGQLTYKGLVQLLKIGEILKQAYAGPLRLLQRHQAVPTTRTLTNTSVDSKTFANWNEPSEIVIYSTRYRRTFQSAMALLYAFLPNDYWVGLNVQESHSLLFCFHDCVCNHAEQIRVEMKKADLSVLHQHPAIAAVVHWVGLSLLQNPTGQINPLEVRDAVLSLLCHEAPLPCRKAREKSLKNVPGLVTTPDNSDFINIDQEDGQMSSKDNTIDLGEFVTDIEPEGCIEESHINALISFTNWQAAEKSRNPNNRKEGLLRAYGLIRNIVGNMLKMISGEKIKFVLYSGHDRTIQYLIAALGIQVQQFFIPYAARMAFEVYRSVNEAQFYFRVVYNGKDVTNKISFCEGGRSLRVSRGIRGEKTDLCPIENIIRFIHDDYFIPLNATSYKDACMLMKANEDF
uniref:2-phosphoxylose phosphatase 1 n=1 Tax=Nyssomyia neivai TaxID=330878 RepID=A0A1L8DNQ8_9DIPT